MMNEKTQNYITRELNELVFRDIKNAKKNDFFINIWPDIDSYKASKHNFKFDCMLTINMHLDPFTLKPTMIVLRSVNTHKLIVITHGIKHLKDDLRIAWNKFKRECKKIGGSNENDNVLG